MTTVTTPGISLQKIIRGLLDARILTSAYLVFFLFAQVEWLQFHLGPTQYVLVLWAYVILINEYVIKRDWIKTPGLLIYSTLVLVAALSFVYNYSLSPVSQIKSGILLVISIFLFYPLGVSLARKTNPEKDVAIIFLPSFVITFVQGVLSLYTLFTVFSYRNVLEGHTIALGLQEYKYNSGATALILFGFNADSNHAAVFATVSVLVTTWLYISRTKIFTKNKFLRAFSVFYWVNLLVQIPCIILSNSRASYLVVIVSIPIIGLFWAKTIKYKRNYSWGKTIALFVAGVFIAGSLFTGITTATENATKAYLEFYRTHFVTDSGSSTKEKEDFSNIDLTEIEYSKGSAVKSARPLIWKEAYEVFKTSPLLGTGPYNTKYYAQKYHIGDEENGFLRTGKAIHNSYLDVLVFYGVLGFLVYVCFFGYLLIQWSKRAVVKRGFDSADLILGFCWLNIMGVVFFLTDSFLGADYLFTVLLILIGYLAHKKTNDKVPMLQFTLV